MVDTRSGKDVQSLRLAQAISVLSACGIKNDAYNQIEDDDSIPQNSDSPIGDTKSMQENHSDSLLPLKLESCGTNSTVAPFVRLLAR